MSHKRLNSRTRNSNSNNPIHKHISRGQIHTHLTQQMTIPTVPKHLIDWHIRLIVALIGNGAQGQNYSTTSSDTSSFLQYWDWGRNEIFWILSTFLGPLLRNWLEVEFQEHIFFGDNCNNLLFLLAINLIFLWEYDSIYCTAVEL